MSEFLKNAERMLNFFREGGFTMGLLLSSMLVLWAALGYRITILRRGSVDALPVLLERARSGVSLNMHGIVTRAALAAARLSKESHPLVLKDSLNLLFHRTFESEMGRFAVVVRSLVVAAPLLGLLGTVSGMMETFRSLDGDGFFAQSGGIAAGIAEALVATQLGLAVAIPGLFVGRTLQRREERLRNELLRLRELVCGE